MACENGDTRAWHRGSPGRTSKFRAMKQLGVDYAQGNRLQQPEHIDRFDFIDCGIQLPTDLRA